MQKIHSIDNPYFLNHDAPSELIFKHLQGKLAQIAAMAKIGVQEVLLESKQVSEEIIEYYGLLAHLTEQSVEMCELIGLKQPMVEVCEQR